MGVGEVCGKCLLVTINILFMLLGLLFFAVGIILTVAADLFKKAATDQLREAFKEILQEAGSSDPDGQIDSLMEEFFALFKVLGIILLVLGIFMLLVTILGCCGACCMVKALLIIYVVIVALILIAEAVIVGLYISGELDGAIKDGLKSRLRDKYEGPNALDSAESVAVNAIQALVSCCGIDNYEDFNETSNWNRTTAVTGPDNSTTYYVELVIPPTCCKLKNPFPQNPIELEDEKCPTNPTEENSYLYKGCFEAVNNKFEQYKRIMLGIAGGFLGIEAVCIVLAACLLALATDKL